MKRLLTCFFAVSMCAPAVFAVDGAISRAVPTADKGEHLARTSASNISGRDTASQSSDKENAAATSGVVRSAVSRVFSGGANSDGFGTVSRATVIGRSVGTETSSSNVARSNLSTAVKTVGRNTRVSSASINSNPAVRRAGLTLRPSTAEVGGRATLAGGVQTGSNIDSEIRNVQSRQAKKEIDRETIAQATERLEQTATLNKSCQDQYNECMDQFCAVIDANQGRCSCSANLSRYTKTEEAVKNANVQLNEVAQRIRYVGLSADEIRAILNETEAEEALSKTKDTSETRNMLEEIEDLIRDPVSNTAYSSDAYTGLDMDLDFTSDTADLFNLDFLNTDNTGSFSNLRGSELYNAAKKRCKTVLNQCKGAGATVNQITGNYDLAIDKDCIAYEQGLTKMNETLVSNVRSANRMLQKARLAVLQNKNQYDARGCIGALETCMKDDMVCGENYFKCVDPTKSYIDENGEVILGKNISNITAFMTNYNNAQINDVFMEYAYKSQSINDTACKADPTKQENVVVGGNTGACITKYLLQKIGTKQNVTDEGLCRAVLEKCQRYTYDANGKYISYNDIVENYVQRAMVNIRAAQHNIISEYASSCMLDIAACYNQQVSQVNSWTTTASISNVRSIMRGACRNVALTCAYAVFYNSDDVICFDKNSDGTIDTSGECSVKLSDIISGNYATKEGALVDAISNIFYQSLLCPENSTYNATASTEYGNEKPYVNEHCKCNTGYVAWGGSCVLDCGDNATHNLYGTCVCDEGYKMENGQCKKTSN